MPSKKATPTPVGINAAMARACPELSSSYAAYPLWRTSWLGPCRAGPNGEAGFVEESDRRAPLQPDYVHGTGPNGVGYYHLLTRDAYRILFKRLKGEAPASAGCGWRSRATKREVSDREDVKAVLRSRATSKVPDETEADQESFVTSRGTEAGGDRSGAISKVPKEGRQAEEESFKKSPEMDVSFSSQALSEQTEYSAFGATTA